VISLITPPNRLVQVRPPSLFTYHVTSGLEDIDPTSMFVYIIRHLFTYQRLKLGLFTPGDGEVIDTAAILAYILGHLFTYQRKILGSITTRAREDIVTVAIFV